MRVLVVHSSHYRAETFFRSAAERGINSNTRQQKNNNPPLFSKVIIVMPAYSLAKYNYSGLGFLELQVFFLSHTNEAVNSPRAWLSYLITYVQDETPVLGCIHLTGCFLWKEKKAQQKMPFYLQKHLSRISSSWEQKKSLNIIKGRHTKAGKMTHKREILFI